jgi:hypothetical protein
MSELPFLNSALYRQASAAIFNVDILVVEEDQWVGGWCGCWGESWCGVPIETSCWDVGNAR